MEKLSLLKQIIVYIFILIILIIIFPFYFLVEALIDIFDFLSMRFSLFAARLSIFLEYLLPAPGSPSLPELIKEFFK